MKVPDNYSRYEAYERENERLKRIHRRQEIENETEFEVKDLPFYEEEGEK